MRRWCALASHARRTEHQRRTKQVHVLQSQKACACHAWQVNEASKACFDAAVEQLNKSSAKQLCGYRKHLKKQCVTVIRAFEGFPKPGGRRPRDCTWDFVVGAWRFSNGTLRPADQTKRNNAAHRKPRKLRGVSRVSIDRGGCGAPRLRCPTFCNANPKLCNR